jgi:Regulator of chromosome condensation (RCC1) repeat
LQVSRSTKLTEVCLRSQFGQLGLGRATPDAYVPEQVGTLEGQKVVDVAAGVSAFEGAAICAKPPAQHE